MINKTLLHTSLLLTMGLAALPSSAAAELDAAFARFWKAEKRAQVRSAITGILALEPDFDTVYERLRTGRPYSADVATGVLFRTRKIPFYYTLVVPEDYDPARRYPVQVLLHGGVGRPQWKRNRGEWRRDYDRLKDPGRISIVPASWKDAMWWEGNQADNLAAILEEVKAEYTPGGARTPG